MPTVTRRRWLQRLVPTTLRCIRDALDDPEPAWVVQLVVEQCIAFRGPECGACVGLCPGPAAIRQVGWKPQLDVTLCSGCGKCVEACPTRPKAIAWAQKKQHGAESVPEQPF